MLINLIVNLGDIFDKAAVPEVIKAGWRKTGIHPYSAQVQLENCTTFFDLDKTEQKRLLALVPQMTAIARSSGRVSDQVMLEANIPQMTENRDSFVEWRQRALWLNNQGVFQWRRSVEEAKQRAQDQKKLEQEAKKQRAEQRKEAAGRTLKNQQLQKAIEKYERECQCVACVMMNLQPKKHGWKKCNHCSRYLCKDCHGKVGKQHKQNCNANKQAKRIGNFLPRKRRPGSKPKSKSRSSSQSASTSTR